MSFISDCNRRKQIAAKYTKILGRTIKASDIRIDGDIESVRGLSQREADFLHSYLVDDYARQGYQRTYDETLEAQVDSILSNKQ